MKIKNTKQIVEECAYLDYYDESIGYKDYGIGCNDEEKEWVAVNDIKGFIIKCLSIDNFDFDPDDLIEWVKPQSEPSEVK